MYRDAQLRCMDLESRKTSVYIAPRLTRERRKTMSVAVEQGDGASRSERPGVGGILQASRAILR